MKTDAQRYRNGEMRIKAAAIRIGHKVWSLDPPARHDAVMRHVFKETGEPVRFDPQGQGFVTECGRFLNRRQAEVVARRSGRLEGELIGSVLTSEDLW